MLLVLHPDQWMGSLITLHYGGRHDTDRINHIVVDRSHRRRHRTGSLREFSWRFVCLDPGWLYRCVYWRLASRTVGSSRTVFDHHRWRGLPHCLGHRRRCYSIDVAWSVHKGSGSIALGLTSSASPGVDVTTCRQKARGI